MLYSKQTWAVHKKQLHRLEIIHMRRLRIFWEMSLKHQVNNDIILGWGRECCKSVRKYDVIGDCGGEVIWPGCPMTERQDCTG